MEDTELRHEMHHELIQCLERARMIGVEDCCKDDNDDNEDNGADENGRVENEGRRNDNGSDEKSQEVDAYIDSRLATLEVILTKTMDAIAKGRERIAGASENDVLSQLAES